MAQFDDDDQQVIIPQAAEATVPADFNFSSQIQMEKIAIVQSRLLDLNASLSHLLASMPCFTKTPSSELLPIDVTEEQVERYRTKVTRRIYFYRTQLAELRRLLECRGLDEKVAQSVIAEHERNLQKYKAEVSAWSHNMERCVPHLRVARLIKADSTELKPSRKIIGSTGGKIDRVTLGLRDLKQNVQVEVERMEATEAVLGDSSGKIAKMEDLLTDFGHHLILARRSLRAEMDSRLVWWAFLCFACVCLYLALKRTQVLRLAVWAMIRLVKTTFLLTFKLFRPTTSIKPGGSLDQVDQAPAVVNAESSSSSLWEL